MLHDHGHVGDAEDGAGELLDHEDRHALSGDVGHEAVQLLHDERGEPHRQLVEQQDGRVGAEGAGHRQHLLLAARHGAGDLPDALLQPGELGEGPRPRRG